jgi:hypothetical protein
MIRVKLMATLKPSWLSSGFGLRELIKKNKNESMWGRGQTPNPDFFGIHFGSIGIQISGSPGRLIPIFGSEL